MKLKKGWLGYFNFFLGTILLSVYLYTLFVSLYENFEIQMGFKVSVFNVPLSVLLSVFFVILVAFLFYLFGFLKRRIIKRNNTKIINIEKIIFWILFLLIFITSLVEKYYYISSIKEVIKSPFEDKLGVYLSVGLSSFSSDNLIANLYLLIADFFLKVFGYYQLVFVAFNAILLTVSSIFVFFSVKFVFGHLPAIFSFLLISITYKPLLFLYDATGICLWVFILSFVLYIFTYFMENFVKAFPTTFFMISIAIIFVIFGARNLVFEPLSYVFIPNESLVLSFISTYRGVSLFVGVLALFGCLSFIIEDKDSISLSVFSLVIFSFNLLFDYSNDPSFLYLLVSIGILCGLGIRGFLFSGYMTDTLSVDYIAAISNEDVILETEDNKNIVDENEISIVKNVSDINVNEADNEKSIVTVEPKLEIPQKPKVKLLDNPLPLPKKHVKKELTYSFEPVDRDMRFDIEIKDNDDFDIK